jgi:hypothetical protein
MNLQVYDPSPISSPWNQDNWIFPLIGIDGKKPLFVFIHENKHRARTGATLDQNLGRVTGDGSPGKEEQVSQAVVTSTGAGKGTTSQPLRT